MFKIASLTLLVACTSHYPVAIRDPARQAALAVEVQVECRGATDPWLPDVTVGVGGRVSRGSGVVLDERRVLTAAHGVACAGERSVHVITSAGRRLRADVASVDRSRDLAVLELHSAGGFDLRAGPPALAPLPVAGDVACAAVAFPRRAEKCGAAIDATWRGAQFGIAGKLGNSGAGVYDREGRLLGIVTKKCDQSECTMTAAVEGAIP